MRCHGYRGIYGPRAGWGFPSAPPRSPVTLFVCTPRGSRHRKRFRGSGQISEGSWQAVPWLFPREISRNPPLLSPLLEHPQPPVEETAPLHSVGTTIFLEPACPRCEPPGVLPSCKNTARGHPALETHPKYPRLLKKHSPKGFIFHPKVRTPRVPPAQRRQEQTPKLRARIAGQCREHRAHKKHPSW